MPSFSLRVLDRCYRIFERFVPCDIAKVYRLVTATSPAPKACPGINFEFVDHATVTGWSEDSSTDISAANAARMANGRVECFAALDNGALVGYLFFGERLVEPENNRASSALEGIGVRLQPSVRFMFKGFVRPEYRGRQIMSHMLEHLAVAWHQRGVQEIITTTSWNNWAFQKSAERVGYESIGHTAEITLFGRHFARYPSSAQAPFEFFADAQPAT